MTKSDAELKAHIQQQITKHKVVVFGKQWDNFTKQARKTLDTAGVGAHGGVRYIDLEDDPSCKGNSNQYMKVLTQLTNGHNKIPMVFVNNQFLGDNEKLEEEMANGQLHQRFHTMNENKKADAGIHDYIQTILNENKVVVFGKKKCNFTMKARRVLDECDMGNKYKYVDVIDDADVKGQTKHWQNVLSQMTGKGQTVPFVFVQGRYIGDGNGMQELFENHELIPILEKAGFIVSNTNSKHDAKKHATGYGKHGGHGLANGKYNKATYNEQHKPVKNMRGQFGGHTERAAHGADSGHNARQAPRNTVAART